ncbi:MAG: hypothetical protein KAT12_00455, partial [Gammaproteobacteria bacterium]|nr:hypothetical protein [Gammaproteobacteria bacterium]
KKLKSSLKKLAQLSSLNRGIALRSIAPEGAAESAIEQAGNTAEKQCFPGLFLFLCGKFSHRNS